jgi:RNA polymerase sigma-70 factor (ECF subfamily)
VSGTTPFRALFDEHAAFVWRVLARHGVATRELEDACQEVFLVVHRRLPQFEGRSSLRTWIYAIAVRVALSFRRKGYRVREQLRELLDQTGSSEADQPERVDQQRTLALIDEALASLPRDKREAFALYELEGMTMPEVAEALGVPENTALYRLYGARAGIRIYLSRRMLRKQLANQAATRGSTP